jgi:hypothetical protein
MYPAKELVDEDIMVQSILALRDELSKQSNTKSREIVFKLNSCLFHKYPTQDK